jgi:ribosome-binding protein aMBF1 (putative translation factor)
MTWASSNTFGGGAVPTPDYLLHDISLVRYYEEDIGRPDTRAQSRDDPARTTSQNCEKDAMTERRHEPVFPGFREMSDRRKALSDDLVERRRALGLSQTQVAARMGTSQSAVARLETGTADVLLSTVDRYAAALGWELRWSLEEEER